ncbi:NAD-dependent protein deacetylase sirtuin-1 [Podarcis muralis]
MADGETPLLQCRSGGRGSSGGGGAVSGASESPEPAVKRQRRGSTDSAGRACSAAKEAGGEAEAPLYIGGAAEEALAEEEEVAAAAAAAASSGNSEPWEASAAVGERGEEGWGCAGLRRWALAREEPPPQPLLQQLSPPPLPRWWPSQGEGAEAAPAGDAAEAAIGCGAAQCSNGAAEAAARPDNMFFNDEIIANGFHSCESDEDDRASHASSSDWTPRPRIGPYTFVQQHLMLGTDPRAILKDLLPETIPPPELDDMTLWQIVINILSEPPKRKKRKDINTIEDAVKLLQECKKIIVLTGAGVSVSCGIPDFRSRDGIYARLAVDFPDLPDPQAMFDIDYFRKDPRPFFKFAKEIYPGQFQPSLCHKFIALMDKEKKLLCNYTQNIDTLEQVAGIQRIIQCHGSFATASCLICKYKVDCEVVRGDIFNQVVPRCPRCSPDEPLAIMKPEIVFFGENLPEQFHRAMKYDKDEVDLLIVIGSSLKVRPVALIPSSIPHEVPQILINREPLPHLHFDVELLGDCDVIINELCHRLGGEYTKLCSNSVKLSEITEKPPRPHKEFEIHSAELPPTPLNISEYSSSPERIAPQHSQVVRSEQSSEYKAGNSDASLESKENCVEEKIQEVQNSLENVESLSDHLENPEHVKENGSNQEENKERSEKTSVETLRKCWVNRCAKEQISKRLDGTQYLFLPPNRYIFHGAEVYSDSEDDVISSSSCGSSSDSGSCHSPSLDIEDESEIEEFYNGIEEDTPDREEENGYGEDGIELQESESVSINEAVGFDHSTDKL